MKKTFITEKQNRIEALKEINLDIGEQEFVCLIGPSGSGKSTLLRLMEGLIFPTEGIVKVKNKIVTGPLPEAGMVFQEYSLMPWRNIIDNVSFGLEIRNIPKIRRYARAEELLEKFGLSEFLQSYPYELSGGMQQRAAIARAIAASPDILFMDEPFGALDAYTRLQMQKDLIDFWLEEKRTVVFVTHSIEESIFLGTKIILMSPRPGQIDKEYDINLPYPRNRFNKKFQEYFEDIMERMNEISKN
nr:ABC transporter ATP-binding protein [Senegalia massiliensis]